MRKLRRNMIRKAGERKKGVKPSRYVRQAWDVLQAARYGRRTRDWNKWRSTRPKRRWNLSGNG